MRTRILLAAPVIAASVIAACGGAPPVPAARPAELPVPLGPPAAIAPGARGAAYLTQVAAHLQPNWAHFLEDCRVRLAPAHPLNAMSLSAVGELAIDRTGKVAVIQLVTSGNADFDRAVRDVLAEAPTVEPPPVELRSDDDRVHVRWRFARDLRQAGPATATLVDVQLPISVVTDRLLAQGELARAARRVAASSVADPGRLAAGERVMTQALREALASVGVGARASAVVAIGRAQVRSLAEPVRALISPTIDTELRLAAVTAVAQLEDVASVDAIAGMLAGDLVRAPRLAYAETEALVALGRRDRAAAEIRRALDAGPAVAALQAHAIVPDLVFAPRLATWFKRGDARIRAAVCSAVPATWGPQVVVVRGLRDPDATVRAACAESVIRQAHRGAATDAATRIGRPALRALRELIRDRDQLVRARAVAALSILEPRWVGRAAGDPAPEVRAATVAAATEAELRALADDPDPSVRAAALAAIGDRAPELLARGASDLAPQVRLAVIAALTDEGVLENLRADDSPEVATEAVVRHATLRGRAAIASMLLTQLAAAAPASAERVRIALGFLLAR